MHGGLLINAPTCLASLSWWFKNRPGNQVIRIRSYMQQLNIDGDYVLFRGCFACEKSLYIVQHEGMVDHRFDTKKEVNEFIETNGLENPTILKTSNLQPLEYALGTMRSMLDKIMEDLKSTKHSVYLTGKNCFRYKLAKTFPYKGNREKTQRPHWLPEATEYLKEKWKAQVMDGMEADDALSMNQTDNSICVSPDKDLDQIDGWHYNPTKEELYYVDSFQAAKCFWTQMLVGDKTDNIYGILGIGPVRAAQLLADLNSDDRMRQRVWDMYVESFGSRAAERFDENMGLLKLLREKIND